MIFRPQIILFSLLLLTMCFSSLAGASALVSKGETWSYLDDGSDQGAIWRSSAFDPSSWATGVASLGYSNGVNTTISYGPDTSHKFITTYFLHEFNVSDPDQYEQLQIELLRDDGVILYLNDTEVLRDNMPMGSVGFLTLASSPVSGSDESSFMNHTIPTTGLLDGRNILAVELHQTHRTSSDLSFDLGLNAIRLVDVSHSFSLTPYTPIGEVLGTVNVFNPNSHVLSYSIVDDVPFSIDDNGSIIGTAQLDQSVLQSYPFTVNVGYGAKTVSTSVTITVEADQPPIFAGGPGHYAVSEIAGIGTSVGFVKATDAEGDALTYSLVEADIPFEIDATTGEITVTGLVNRGAGVQQTITVAVTDQNTSVEQQQSIFIIPAADANTSGILLEHWSGIGGNSVSNLTSNPNYPSNPTQTTILTSFEAPSQDYGSYGQRARGYLKVTESAEYTFWIASDDESELRLSSDTSPANMGESIATVDGWTSAYQWTKYASQKSVPVSLVAGRLYYIEALHKEGNGGDHVEVALQKTGEASQTLINGTQVIPPYVVDSVVPTPPTGLGTDSVSTSSVELVWSAATDAIGVTGYSIYRDGVLLTTVAGDILSYTDATVSANTAHNYQIIAIDAFGNASTAATLVVDTSITVNSVEIALQTGDARPVLNENNLIQAAIDEIDAGLPYMRDEKIQLFNLNADGSVKSDGSSLTAISWDPTHDAATFIPVTGQSTDVLQTNAVTDTDKTVYEKTIGIIGETPARYMVLGSNPLRNARRNAASVNEQMHQFMENSLSWLTARNDLKTQQFNVVIAHMKQSYYFPDEVATREWLDSHYAGQVTYNDRNACEGSALTTCLNSTPDLLIISQSSASTDNNTAIAASVAQAMGQGIPVLYMHLDGGQTDLGKALFPVFGVSYEWDNRNKNLRLTDYDASQKLASLPENYASVKRMFEHLRDADYAFDWSQCNNDKSCNTDSLQDTEFLQGATVVKSILDGLDNSKQNIFSEQGLRLYKLLALIGDRFRQDVQYPMDKETTNDTVFMKSFYADHAVYNYRLLNPAQPDMGNFSRSDFSHITPITKTVDLISKKNFRSTGAYALPGQTLKVTRNDNSDLTVKVFINTLRSGATHQYQASGYKRPKYLTSPYFEIKAGETIELTSPYGGPIQLSFSTNDLPVNVTFENVGEHAYWASSEDNASFTTKLNAGDFDWAEIVTAGFEVHSTLEKMRQSVANSKWGSAQALAEATETYMSNYPHVLAGFRGPGIDVVPEIHDFAAAKGWSINNLDLVKHMNADQANCGYGCSGNPYDAYWSFSPTGHGDVHELGHGLERSRFKYSGWETHSQTNPYSYYTKSKYHETTGGDPSCQSLPFETAFNALQSSIGEADVEAFMKTNYWDSAGWSQQFMMTLQMMMTTQKMGKLESGWHLLARLHIHEREFGRADNNDSDWAVGKDSLGFSDYTRTEATATSNNDYMLMAMSTVAELDFRDYLSMWGISYSEKAANQVASYGYESVPREFFISASTGYCKTLQNGDYLAKATLAVDGNQTWPASTDSDSDSYWDEVDNCPSHANTDQVDSDGDGIGNACDTTPSGDTDSDGVEDDLDNCPLLSNAIQRDTNNDGFGNLCDPDLNDNNVVDFDDYTQIKKGFFSADGDADMDGDGVVNFSDLSRMKLYWDKAPGAVVH